MEQSKPYNKMITNEEIVEEILHEAEKLKIRVLVLNKAVYLRQIFPSISILESIETAFNEVKSEKYEQHR